MTDIDLPVADSAYATLLDPRRKPRNIAADLARPLMNETENLGVRSHEIEIMKADAWLAIVHSANASTPNLRRPARFGRERSAARTSGKIF